MICRFASLALLSNAPYTGLNTAMASFVFVKAAMHHMMAVITLGALVSQSLMIVQL